MNEDYIIFLKDYSSWLRDIGYIDVAIGLEEIIDTQPAPRSEQVVEYRPSVITTDQLIETFGSELKGIYRQAVKDNDIAKINNIQPYIDRINGVEDSISDEDVQQAKLVPVESILDTHGYEVKRNKALCPFHTDKSPSLQIYRDTNSVYCFACQSSADSIGLYAKLSNRSLNGKDFIEVVKEILDKFA